MTVADTTEKAIADEMREAAALLRETAITAIAGPWASLDGGDRLVAWRTGDNFEYVVDEPIDGATAEWMALVNPLLAEPLAAWLEKAAKDFDEQVISEQGECPACGDGCYADHGTYLVHDGGCCGVLLEVGEDRCQCFALPLAVARVLNGTGS